MRICHVIDNMFLDRGGPVAVVAGLAGAQAARGGDVNLLCRSRLRHGELLGEEHALDPRIIVVETEPSGSASRKCVSAALEALAPNMLHVHGCEKSSIAKRHRGSASIGFLGSSRPTE